MEKLQNDKLNKAARFGVLTEESDTEKKAEASMVHILNGRTIKLEENSLETEPAHLVPAAPIIPTNDKHYILQATLSSRMPSQESKLPSTKIAVPFNFSRDTTRGIFRHIATKFGFRIIDRGENFLTAVHQAGFSLRRLLCCFQVSLGAEQVTAVKLLVEPDEHHWQRTITVKGLSGNRALLRAFLHKYNKLLEREKEVFKKSERSHAAITSDRDGVKSAHLDSESYNRVLTEEDAHGETVANVTESSSYYIFHKILSSKSYTLGKKMADFLTAFPEKYKDVAESAKALPKPLKEIMDMVNVAVRSFYQQYNYGKSGTRDLMQYCRPSVEKYVFSKLYDKIFAMYIYKSSEDDTAVVKKIAELKKYKGRNLMKQLEFKERYIIVSEEDEKLGKIGYDSAINSINKVEKTLYPHEKLSHIMQMYAEMKTAVIDYTRGKHELAAMDDQMPAFIYIMAMANLTHPIAEMNLLFDYLRYQEKSYDTEQLLVTNLQASLMYILKEFNPK